MARADLLDPRNGPSWDHPPDPAARTYVVASLPRTGSTLLCNALWDLGVAGAPKEYLNPMQIRDWEVRLGGFASRWRHRPLRQWGLAWVGRSWGADAVAAHLERVRARRSVAGWFGLKLHAHHRRRWFPDDRLPPVLGPITWIRVTRRDRLAQAVSWARAAASQQWASTQPAGVARYSRRAVQRKLDAIARDEADWDAFFARHGPPALTLTYEAIAADLGGAVAQVAAALGVPAPAAPAVPSLQRQADGQTAVWIARFQRGG